MAFFEVDGLSDCWSGSICFGFDFLSSFSEVLDEIIDSFGGIGFIGIFDWLNIFFLFLFDLL